MRTNPVLIAVLVLAIRMVNSAAAFVIDDFEQGGSFSLTANESNPMASHTASPIDVPGGVREVNLTAPNAPDRFVNAMLADTAGDDAIVFSGMNPPNNGFGAADILYGSALGEPSLHLDLTPFGDRFYVQLADDIPGSGYYINVLLYTAGTGVFFPTIPGGPGTGTFIVPDGRGRYEINFTYFTNVIDGTAFDASDIDGLQISLVSSEVRIGHPPLKITEFGVVPEPTRLALLVPGLLALLTLSRT